jgi:hypothetical protein
MPDPPAGEQQLRDLAHRYASAEGQALGLIVEAANGGDRGHLAALGIRVLSALLLLDPRLAVVAAYLAAHPKGQPESVRDLAGGLHKRLDQGVRVARDNYQAVIAHVAADRLEYMAAAAVTAHVDSRGNRWALSTWATMNTDTTGRQATTRGISDRVGEGRTVMINVSGCGWCESHAGPAVVGKDPLPPYHARCRCTVTI